MKLAFVTAVVAVGLAVAGCGSSGTGSGAPAAATTGSAAPAANAVDIKDYAYAPANLTVPVGTAVTWTMSDGGTIHTVTDTAQHLDSGDLKQGKTFTYTFRTPGTYHYLCTYHPYMKGTITVQ